MVADKIALEIEKSILSGEMERGSKLPPERKLSEIYGVSRTTIREAIKKVEQLGLVETLPQSGTFVSDYLQDASLDLLIHLMRDPDSWDRKTLLSLFEARRVLEEFAVARSVTTATDEDIHLLRSIANSLTPEDHGLSAERDYALHYQIMKMSSNIAFLLMFNSFKPLYTHLTGLFFGRDDTIGQTMEQHRRLIDCFERRDRGGALSAMEEILLFGEMKVKEYIDENRN